MKLKFLILLFIISFASFADYSVRASYGFLFNEEISKVVLREGSYDLYGEYFIEPIDNISIGFGASYSWPAEYKVTPPSNGVGSNPIDSSIPIFAAVILSVLPDSNIEPYLIGRLGTNIITPNKNSKATNVTGDIFTSWGVGGYFSDFFVEGTYDKSAGFYRLDNKRQTMDYTRFTLKFGYKFNFINNKKVKLHDKQKEVIVPQKNIEYDNLEKFDANGNIIEKKGIYKEINDMQIIE